MVGRGGGLRKGTSGKKKTRNRFKQHSKLLPNKTGNLSRALREMPARRRYAVFQLISSERKNDAVIATAICSEHKSRARDYGSHRYIYIAPQNGYFRVFIFSLFFFAARRSFRARNREAIIAIISLSTRAGDFYRRAPTGDILSALFFQIPAAKSGSVPNIFLPSSPTLI